MIIINLLKTIPDKIWGDILGYMEFRPYILQKERLKNLKSKYAKTRNIKGMAVEGSFNGVVWLKTKELYKWIMSFFQCLDNIWNFNWNKLRDREELN